MGFGRLAQGFPPDQPTGMDTLEFITYDSIPKYRRKDITYLRLVTADRPHKIESKRVRATAGGDRINYPFDVSTRTAELQTSKILINSTISTPGARFMTLDISDFFLTTKEMKRPEFIRIKLDVIPDKFIKQYNLEAIAHNGHVYAQINGGMYGLPQAGKLANDLLVDRLTAAGYIQSKHVNGLFKHTTLPIQFCLIVDDFGVKYVGRDNALHLVNLLASHYKITQD
jgi:hypothetical protein